MSQGTLLQGVVDQLTEIVERIERDMPALVEHATAWKRGYVGPGPAGSGGGSGRGESPTERIAAELLPGGRRQPDPSRDVERYIREVRRWSRQADTLVTTGMKLDQARASLLPLSAVVAALLVDGDVEACRAHQAADLSEPVLREDGGRDGLCWWCWRFRHGRDGKGGYGVDPPVGVVRKHHRGERVDRRFIDAELSPPRRRRRNA